MELWIRSQNKTYLTQNPKLKIEVSVYNEWSITEKNTSEELGLYKTKKRAIEVLDEIQKFLQPEFKCDGYETETTNKYYSIMKLHFSEPNIFHKRVYEMPKE